MGKKVGIGIIGTGFARRVQIPAFLACDGAWIASVASGNPANAQEVADEFGIGHFTGDWRDTILHPEVDLVCITTPPNLHRDMTLFAAEHGKHILCEKPMAFDLAEAVEMATSVASTGKIALIDHELRFQPGRQYVHKKLREGVIGKIRHAKFIFQAPQRGDATLPWNWWSDVTAGGGALGAIVSHIIDSFHWMLGTEASRVFCQLQTHIKYRTDREGIERPVTTDDESNLLLRFFDSDVTADATGLISVSMTEYPEYRNQFDIYGEKGAYRIDHIGRVFICMSDESSWREVDVELSDNIPGIADTGFARGFMNFAPPIIRAINSGSNYVEHAATFADGVKVQKVLDAARLSDAEGRAVGLEE